MNNKSKIYKPSEQFQDQFSKLYPEFDNLNKENENDMLVKNITFVTTETCNLNCTYCVSGDTLITMSDFSKKRIDKIKIGDEILAFNELSDMNNFNSHNKIQLAKVEKKYKHKEKIITIILENGEKLKITKNHKLLARRNRNSKGKSDWKEAGKFKVGQYVYTTIPVEKYICNKSKLLNNKNYIIGYIVANTLGDATIFDGYEKGTVPSIRYAQKDDDIMERIKYCLDFLNISDIHYSRFCISKKDKKIINCIKLGERGYNIILNYIEDYFDNENSKNYARGFLAGIYDAEGHISKQNCIRISNGDTKIINEIAKCLNILNIKFIIEHSKISKNGLDIRNIRIKNEKHGKYNLKFVLNVIPACERKYLKNFQSNNSRLFKRIKIKEIIDNNEEIDVYNIGTTSKTYFANNIAVHNCYETHKSKKMMTNEVAKKAIDAIFDKEKMNGYVTDYNKAVIIEFIGGEPFINVDVMDFICEYFLYKATILNHPWAKYHMFSVTSNGTLLFDKKVMDWIQKYKNKLSLSITIDGNKELHDSCRLFFNGKGSYDTVEKAVKYAVKELGMNETKVTFAPENIDKINTAIPHLFNLGLKDIHANCVFENVWKPEHEPIFYHELIKLADYMIDNDLYTNYACNIFDENIGSPMDPSDNKNWLISSQI